MPIPPRSTTPIFPLEILHCKRQWSRWIENRFAHFQGQNNHSIKSLSHPSQTTEAEMKIPRLCASDTFLTQQSASTSLPLQPKGQSVPNSLRSLSVILQTSKKRTPSAWLCEKRDCGEIFHTFSSPCIHFQCCTLPGWELELKCTDSILVW